MNTKLIAISFISLSALGLGQAQAQGSGAPGGGGVTDPGAGPQGAGSAPAVNGAGSAGKPTYPSTPPAAGAPKSSLSPDANTPRANSNGATLPGTVKAFSDTQSRQGPKPANAGAINPDAPNPKP